MACKMSYKVLPSLSELIDGRVSVKALRDIRYEDILGRPEINLDVGGIHDFLANRTVFDYGLRRFYPVRNCAGRLLNTSLVFL